MSNQIIFKVARDGKIDGKEWKAGDHFPFDPSNRQHKLFYQLEILLAEIAPQPKAAAAKKRTGKAK